MIEIEINDIEKINTEIKTINNDIEEHKVIPMIDIIIMNKIDKKNIIIENQDKI